MKKALIVVDVQKDFCEGGSLAVEGANSIVPLINETIEKFRSEGDIVIVSRELHPTDHKSFASVNNKNAFDPDGNGDTLWPDHCVANTNGSEFHAELDIENVEIFTKGKDQTSHPYSAFGAIGDKTDLWLYDFLHKQGVTDVYVCGLALDFCVAETVLESISYGFRTLLIKDACASIDKDVDKFYKMFKLKHIEIV